MNLWHYYIIMRLDMPTQNGLIWFNLLFSLFCFCFVLFYLLQKKGYKKKISLASHSAIKLLCFTCLDRSKNAYRIFTILLLWQCSTAGRAPNCPFAALKSPSRSFKCSIVPRGIISGPVAGWGFFVLFCFFQPDLQEENLLILNHYGNREARHDG